MLLGLPTEAVHVTMATSSGEEAWYVTDPSSFVTGVTWKSIFISSVVISQVGQQRTL
jgi:hypothetical protein